MSENPRTLNLNLNLS